MITTVFRVPQYPSRQDLDNLATAIQGVADSFNDGDAVSFEIVLVPSNSDDDLPF